MKTKLKSLSKLVLLFLMFTTTGVSQSITNTLGTNGLFTIKDASTNYLTLSQSTGQVNIFKTLRLENTTSSTTGIIFKDAERFLHNFGVNNIFLGINSGNFTMTGINNTAVGRNSLKSNNTGTNNTAMGLQSLYSNTEGNQNTALGRNSLNGNTTGSENTAVGYSSLFTNTTGSENTAVGINSLHFNTGSENTALGSASLYSNTIGNQNTALGLNSLYSNTIGTQNTALGYSSGSNVTTGDNLTLIGYNAEPTIGAANNQITLGNNAVTSLRCNVQTITSLSDIRDKKNIKDLSLGLDFLMKVKPRLFNWDKREWYENNTSDGSKIQETPTAGFIAQELDEVQTIENAEWLNLVLKDNPEKIEASYGNLLPVMVKAIQELKAENDMLKDRLVKFEHIVNDAASDRNTSLNSVNQNKTISKIGEQK